MYKKGFKRVCDILCSVVVFILFGWLYVIIAVLVRFKLGRPIIHSAVRIGRNGKAFKLIKFRSMTNATDENGNLLPDTERLTRFGRMLRASSLDELPEFVNIIKGDMSFIGPRPMPEIYMPYFTEQERKRHEVSPGLTGWAQVNGRNSLSWAEKFSLDCWYVENLTFFLDIKIIFKTIKKVFQHADIGQGEEAPQSLHIERANWELTSQGALPKE